jgi:hypothetical protein
MLPTNEFISQTEAAARKGCSRKALARLMAKGLIQTATGRGNVRRVLREPFDQLFPVTAPAAKADTAASSIASQGPASRTRPDLAWGSSDGPPMQTPA